MNLSAKEMTETYNTLDQKPYDTRYRYFENIVAAPVEKVWPHALRIGSWMTDYRLVTLSGEPGKVGHFERLYSKSPLENVPLPHYHLYGIADIVPFKSIAMEIFPEVGGSYGNVHAFIGFDNVLLVDMGGETKVIMLLLVVNLSKEKNEADIDKDQRMEEATKNKVDRYFENLKKLTFENGK